MLPADFLPAYLLPLMHLLLEVARRFLGVLSVVTTVVCFIALHYHVTRRQHTWLMGGLGLSFGGLALVTPWLVLWVSAPAIYVFAAGTLTQVCVLGLGLLAARYWSKRSNPQPQDALFTGREARVHIALLVWAVLTFAVAGNQTLGVLLLLLENSSSPDALRLMFENSPSPDAGLQFLRTLVLAEWGVINASILAWGVTWAIVVVRPLLTR